MYYILVNKLVIFKSRFCKRTKRPWEDFFNSFLTPKWRWSSWDKKGLASYFLQCLNEARNDEYLVLWLFPDISVRTMCVSVIVFYMLFKFFFCVHFKSAILHVLTCLLLSWSFSCLSLLTLIDTLQGLPLYISSFETKFSNKIGPKMVRWRLWKHFPNFDNLHWCS